MADDSFVRMRISSGATSWQTAAMFLTTLQLRLPALHSTKLPLPSLHAIQWLMLDLTMNSLPICFHKSNSMAPHFVSFKGTFVDMGISPSAGHEGRGVTALLPSAKFLINKD